MATIYGALNPPAAATYLGSTQLNGTHTGADGDIFVRTSGINPQWRFSATPTPVWTQIVPPGAAGLPTPTFTQRVDQEVALGMQRGTTLSDIRGDTVPRGGSLNARLAKVADPNTQVPPTHPWALGWASAASGVVGPGDEGRFVQSAALPMWEVHHNLDSQLVDVTVIAADGETILVPRIEFATALFCRLHFRDPVSGTVIVRR